MAWLKEALQDANMSFYLNLYSDARFWKKSQVGFFANDFLSVIFVKLHMTFL